MAIRQYDNESGYLNRSNHSSSDKCEKTVFFSFFFSEMKGKGWSSDKREKPFFFFFFFCNERGRKRYHYYLLLE